MGIGHNCRHCGDSPSKGKRKKYARIYKRRGKQQILDMVRAWIIAYEFDRFNKELISVQLQLQEHEVSHALHQLNLEGLINQPIHLPPHDSTRDSWGGHDSSWIGDVYEKRK